MTTKLKLNLGEDMYYNTNNETGQRLTRSRSNANTQRKIILDLFKGSPNLMFSPFDVYEITGLNAPITSIRRAITDLTGEGKLVKSSIMKMGPYGKQVHCWKLS